MKTIIEVKDVKTVFGSNVIHDSVTFHVNEGEIFGILGGSGSGKSTILRQIIMLQENQGGTINVLGHNLKTIHPKEAHILRTQWGVLFQFGALFSSLTVLENVDFCYCIMEKALSILFFDFFRNILSLLKLGVIFKCPIVVLLLFNYRFYPY